MKRVRVLVCFLFILIAAPWGVSCKQREKTAAIRYDMALKYAPEEATVSGEESV